MAAGLSLAELAAAVGCKDRRIVKYWQRGERCPSAVMAGRLEYVLGVPIPMPPIRPEDLTGRSLRRIRRDQVKVQARATAQYVAPLQPPATEPRTVNLWAQGWQ